MTFFVSIFLISLSSSGKNESPKESNPSQVSILDIFEDAEWAFIENPNPKTFAGLSPSFQDQVLGAILVEIFRAHKTGEVPGEIQAMHEILKAELPRRNQASMKRINESAFAAAITSLTSESFPASLQNQLAVQYLRLANQGDPKHYQESICNGLSKLFEMNGIKKVKTSSQISYQLDDPSELSTQKKLLINIIAQSGINLSNQCYESVDPDDEGSPKLASNILIVLKKVIPEIQPYFTNTPPKTKTALTPGTFPKSELPPTSLCSELEIRCLLRDSLDSMSRQKGATKSLLGLRAQSCQVNGRLEKNPRGLFLLSPLYSQIRDPREILFRTIDDLVFSLKSQRQIRASDPQDMKILQQLQTHKILDCRSVFMQKTEASSASAQSSTITPDTRVQHKPRSSNDTSPPATSSEPAGGAIFLPFSAK